MLLGRIYRIFQRYADIHVTFSLSGGVLHNPHGDPLGAVERLAVQSSRIVVEGHAQARRVSMRINRTKQTAVPTADPARNGRRVFAMDFPLEVGSVELVLETENGPVTQMFGGVTGSRLRIARALLAGRFFWTLLCLLPALYAWKWQGNLGARETVKQRLGLAPQAQAVPLSITLLSPPPALLPTRMATLVMPVFNAFDMLEESLSRIAAHSGSRWRLIVVEDCSSDARVRPFLQAWAEDPLRASQVQILLNDENLGFVGSANRAFKAAEQWPDDPVVLVNSDVFVPQGWLGRLLAPLSDASVASVTPMSNDAEIFTVPVLCQRGDIAPGAVDRLDAAAAAFSPATAAADAPTGIGYCMAMAPQFLAQVPQFDTIFGRGYGEETDWCQKTRTLGGRHLGIGNVFVEHRGGASFGSATKQRLLEENLSEITRRYPRYDAEVQDFIRRDPLATARLALALVWAGAHQATDVPVYLAHSMGGGAEMYLQRRIAQDLAAGGSAVVLRVGQLLRWQIEVHTALGLTQGTLDDTDAMAGLIGMLPNRRVVYSCGVGDRDAVTLPDILLRLTEVGAHPVEVLVHDFFPISPSYTLLGADGQYRGVPVAGGAGADDPAHRPARPQGAPATSLADWQTEWGRLIGVCEQITVFCETSRDLMGQAYPQALKICKVVPHELLQVPARIKQQSSVKNAPPNKGPVIGVLGNIGVQKGAAVLQRLSRDLAREGRGHVVVIGQMDPDFRLSAPSHVHGGYVLRDLPGLVARHGISCWLIPSIWPETFSFTTHEALATGLPVFAFDLGAQGEAVARAVAGGAAGGVLPLPQAGAMDPSLILSPLAQMKDAI